MIVVEHFSQQLVALLWTLFKVQKLNKTRQKFRKLIITYIHNQLFDIQCNRLNKKAKKKKDSL